MFSLINKNTRSSLIELDYRKIKSIKWDVEDKYEKVYAGKRKGGKMTKTC